MYTLTLRNGNGIIKNISFNTIEAARMAFVKARSQSWVSWQLVGPGVHKVGYFDAQAQADAQYIASMHHLIGRNEMQIAELEDQFRAAETPEDYEWMEQVGYGILETLREEIAHAQGEIDEARGRVAA